MVGVSDFLILHFYDCSIQKLRTKYCSQFACSTSDLLYVGQSNSQVHIYYQVKLSRNREP